MLTFQSWIVILSLIRSFFICMEPKMICFLWQADAASTLRQNYFQDKCVKMTTKWTLNKERSAIVPVYSDQYADNRSDECNYEGRIV